VARPQKTGLDYFNLDTDFESDDKIELVLALHGNEGMGIIIRLWARMYRTTDGELDLSDPDVLKTLCKRLAITQQKLDKLVATACKCGLFASRPWTETKRLVNDRVKRSMGTVERLRNDKRDKYAQTPEFRHDFSGVSELRNIGETPQSKDIYKEKKREIDKETTPLPPTETKSPSLSLDEDDVFKIANAEKIPTIPREIAAACSKYSPEWVKSAIKEAVSHGKREWRYVAGVLGKCLAEGHAPGAQRGGNGARASPDDTDKYIKGPYGHLVQRRY